MRGIEEGFKVIKNGTITFDRSYERDVGGIRKIAREKKKTEM